MMGIDVGGVILSSPGTTLSVDGAGGQWMAVNANGILTRPQAPYMRGTIPNGSGNPYNAGGTPLKIAADVNVGNCWNNTTGLFTCPVAGYYLMTGSSIAGGVANPSGYYYCRKNGVDQHFTHWNHAGTWHYVGLSGILLAVAGDYFSWHLTGLSPANAGFHGNGGHCMFSIALMA